MGTTHPPTPPTPPPPRPTPEGPKLEPSDAPRPTRKRGQRPRLLPPFDQTPRPKR